ncbi:MAG: hypothetical protein WD063_14920 [Pirellulales bacterium]
MRIVGKHRVFNGDRFLDKFQGHEELLKGYCRLWGRRLNLAISTIEIPGFKKWLSDDNSHSDAKDELMDGLFRCYDISSPHGHEDLKAACHDFRPYNPDPDDELPVECLALKVRTEREDAFNLAYDRHALFHAERFSIYRGRSKKPIQKLKVREKSFQAELAKEFQDHKSSERVLVRSYQDGDYTNFIVYHEKRVKSTLIFKGSKNRPRVGPTVFRPAQQDFISYNASTGQVEIESGHEAEEETVRKCFAKCFFSDADFFDADGAAECLNLGELANASFHLDVPDDHSAALVQLRFKLPQEGGPTFCISSKDVFRTLESNGLRRKLRADMIQSAVIKVSWPDDKRGKRIQLSGQNKIKFNRATHADDIFRLLTNWELLISHEDEIEDETPREVDGFATASPPRNKQSNTAISRSRAVSKTRTAQNPKRPRPR